jgi:hypothetical protein
MITGIGVAIILVAIGVSTTLNQPQPVEIPETKPFQIITVGPVWNTDSWSCTSDEDFIIHGTLRGLGGALLEINVSDTGSQSLLAFDEGKMESFSVGAPAGKQIVITRTGTITGFITLQTSPSAQASCTQI